MNNEIILQLIKQLIKQQKPKCYEYFESNIIPQLEMHVKSKLYKFTPPLKNSTTKLPVTDLNPLYKSEFLDSKLLDELLFDVIKILWQNSEIQRQYINIVILLFCEEDNFHNLIEQKGGIGSIYPIIFALLILMNVIMINANIHNRMKGGPPRRPQNTVINPVIMTPNEMQNPFLLHDFSTQPTEIYKGETFLMEFQKIIDLLSVVNYAKPGMQYLQSKTSISLGTKLLKRINSLKKASNSKENVHKRLISALKFFGFDINKLILDSGIKISLGFAETIGFSELLSELISVGLLPEVKFAILVGPEIMKDVFEAVSSLEPTVAYDREAKQRFIELISSFGGKYKRNTKRRKMRTKKYNKKTIKTYNKRST